MTPSMLELLKMALTGLPNFVGLVVAAIMLYGIAMALDARNQRLVDALLVCATK